MGVRRGGWESRLWRKLKMKDPYTDQATRKERKKKKISGDEMDETYSNYVRNEKCTQSFFVNSERKILLGKSVSKI
jgi:hypothetical protein